MANLVAIEAEFSNLTTRSGVVRRVDGILDQAQRKSWRRVASSTAQENEDVLYRTRIQVPLVLKNL